MIIISETQTRLGITVGCLFFGFLLAIVGLISGNEPLIKPDLREAREIAWKNRITSERLSEWILSGRRDFYMVGFREEETCLITDHRNRFFECYDLADLKNPFWLRRYFPNLNVPMVVYSGDGSKSLDVSSWLNYYGYKVHLLVGGYQDFVKKYVVPVDVASARNEQERKQLEHKQLLYWYFSGKDPNISAQSYGNTNLMQEGTMLEDEAGGDPVTQIHHKPRIRESARPLVRNEAEEGC
ncbi:MAG: hypothetical protein MJE63_06855 [Proteobacteria bacterium]|nr:hypothetical protein [Pseudomonadota bacterium]